MKINLFVRNLFVLCLLAMPFASQAQTTADNPLKGQKVLLFSKTKGFRHSSILTGKLGIMGMGYKYGFTVDTTEVADAFTEANLKNYRAVIFLNTTGDFLNDEQQTAFENYIHGGGAYVGIHAAADGEYKWPFYGKLVGGWFMSHPLLGSDGKPFDMSAMRAPAAAGTAAPGGAPAAPGAPATPPATPAVPAASPAPVSTGAPAGTATAAAPAAPRAAPMRIVSVLPGNFTVVDKNFPATASMPATFRANDEFYDYKDFSPDVHVVLTLDEGSYTGAKMGAGDHHPISWYHEFEGGRAFYTGLGHPDDSFLHPLLMDHLWGGLKWAVSGKKPAAAKAGKSVKTAKK